MLVKVRNAIADKEPGMEECLGDGSSDASLESEMVYQYVKSRLVGIGGRALTVASMIPVRQRVYPV